MQNNQVDLHANISLNCLANCKYIHFAATFNQKTTAQQAKAKWDSYYAKEQILQGPEDCSFFHHHWQQVIGLEVKDESRKVLLLLISCLSWSWNTVC